MAAQGGRGGGASSQGKAGLSSKLMNMKFMQKGARQQGGGEQRAGQTSDAAATAAVAANAAAIAGAAAAVATVAATTATAATSAPAAEKKGLSSKLMGMKFMQRGAEKQKLQPKVEEQEVKDAEAHWVAPAAPGAKRCVVISERDPLPEVASGRMSFRSFNPTTEALQRQDTAGTTAAATGCGAGSGVDVSDAQMASELGKRLQEEWTPVMSLRMQKRRKK